MLAPPVDLPCVSSWSSGVNANRFVASVSHEETLARLDYLVKYQRRIGVLSGPSGGGKSLLLSLSARKWRQANCGVALVNALQLTMPELLARVAADWRHPIAFDKPLPLLWQAVLDAMTVQRCERRASLILVDDAGVAAPEVLAALERLAHAADASDSQFTLVFALQPEQLAHLGAGILSRVDLRMDLAPLDVTETQAYLQAQLDERGAIPPRLEASAAERLFELSAGLPRRLNQLANLVMLAAAGEGRETIDAATIDNVYQELTALPLS